MRTRHYRIVKPVRFFIFVLISIMIIIFAGYGLVNPGKASAATAESYARVVIQSDDTLWSLAELYNPDSDISYRDIVYDICDVNGIDAGDIHPGDVVYIPIY